MAEEVVGEVDEVVEEGEEDSGEVDEAAGLEVAGDLAVEEAVGDGDSCLCLVSEKRTNALFRFVLSKVCVCGELMLLLAVQSYVAPLRGELPVNNTKH